jgi:hypothetical protein
LIAEYLEQKRLICNYLLAEIVLSDEPISTGTTPLTLIRLTRFVGFRIANLPYYAPDPLIVRDKDACRAALMMLAQPDKPSMQAEEMLDLIRVVYFKHYAAWYRRVMTPAEYSDYEQSIKTSFDEIAGYVRAEKKIKINGMKNFDMPYIVEPAKRVTISLVGYALLFAFPAIFTIFIAFEHDTFLAAASVTIILVLFGLMLVPKFRTPLLRFFQLER